MKKINEQNSSEKTKEIDVIACVTEALDDIAKRGKKVVGCFVALNTDDGVGGELLGSFGHSDISKIIRALLVNYAGRLLESKDIKEVNDILGRIIENEDKLSIIEAIKRAPNRKELLVAAANRVADQMADAVKDGKDE